MATSGNESETSRAEDLPSVIGADLEREKTQPSFDEAPEGGARAWLVAVGAACIYFSTLGYANSFGVYQEYYMTHQLRDRSPDDIAWIGSLSSFLQFGGGLLGGPLYDRYGAWVLRPAAVLYVFGLMMTSLCTKYWHFMLTHGVLIGTLMGLMNLPAIAAVTQYFDKKRAAALGLAISGSSIGGIVFPIALSKLLNESSLGFGWSVRIIGFIQMPLLLFSSVAIKSRLPPKETSFFLTAAFKRADFNLCILSLFFIFLGMFTPLFYLPTYAVSRGMSVSLASYMLAILNAASTFGRIIPGILADRLGRINVLACAGIVNGIVIFCFNEPKSTAGIVVYAVVFGFASGAVISGGAAALSALVSDPQTMGTYTGMALALAGIAVLIGPPINGALADNYGGFFEVSVFSGVMCLVGGLVGCLAKATTAQGVFGKV